MLDSYRIHGLMADGGYLTRGRGIVADARMGMGGT